MNEIMSEKIEPSAGESASLVAVEVEDGIREFVRNDIAYLRRPGQTPPVELSDADATVKNVNSLIQRVAGTSLGEMRS